MSDLEPASQKPFLPEFVERARDVISVQRVFGEPIETDGAIVVPAATVSGGGGGGTGLESDGRQGNGGGFGLHARPAGALVILSCFQSSWTERTSMLRKLMLSKVRF
jgi:uncharacterized spore protein YtfJ